MTSQPSRLDLTAMRARCRVVGWRTAVAAALALASGVAWPQGAPAWPSRPIHIVIPYAAGSSPDVFTRVVAEKLGPRLGQPIVVDNRPGAGGNTGTQGVAKAPGDGYTFVVSTNGPLVYNTVLYKKLGYDPFTELRPVVLGGTQASVCAVRADSGIASIGQLVRAMKTHPGQYNFASIGVGSLSHLGVELLKSKTDTFAVHIPYASSPLAIVALLQGDVQFACVPGVAVMPQVKAGKLRALAVTTARRSALMPDIPTLKEAGLPDVENSAWMALMAPAGTPSDIVERMNREVNDALALPDVRERLASAYMEPVGGSSDDLRRFLQHELVVMTPVIKRSGATVD
ncbi:MAG: tripartite tricarboxylate transporter substrate binding protein [Pseudomonadota bacterium]|nr:tripartite tricarboxylate transporter substrate binding protein [Pseudomonadota bacterium]